MARTGSNHLHLHVLRVLQRKRAATRKEIAEALGVSLSAVTRIVGDLTDCALVEEGAAKRPRSAAEGKAADSRQGRPAKPVRLVPSAAYAVGLAVASDYITAVVVDLSGRVLARVQQPTRVTTSKDLVLEQLRGTVEAAVTESGANRHLILGYGVGLHTPIDTRSGVCAGWPNTPEWSSLWEGLSLSTELAGDLGPHILVGNANPLAALAEHRFGAAQGEGHFLYVHIGIGVGGALFVAGEPYSGSRGVSGEIGHITVAEDGPRCNCGNSGCLEALASIPALLRYARLRLEAGRESLLRRMCDYDWTSLTLNMIIQAANANDKFAFDILNRCGEYAGIGIATALNLYGTELVVVRSKALKGQDIVLSAIRRTVTLRALPIITPHVRIEPATLGPDAPPLGAATAVMERAFVPPGRIAELYAF